MSTVFMTWWAGLEFCGPVGFRRGYSILDIGLCRQPYRGSLLSGPRQRTLPLVMVGWSLYIGASDVYLRLNGTINSPIAIDTGASLSRPHEL
ncbi:hypothetical protein O9992_07810 [Vibrio lentus]|nr:hypothetical protein [Vibrio lentus]